MKQKLFIFLLLLIATPVSASGGRVIILCYHDIPKAVQEDKYGVDEKQFVETLEFLKSRGYSFISLDELIDAGEGRIELPPRSVLLTFDDGYKTFYDFVSPLLREYNIPGVLSVVSSWIDGDKPEDLELELMDWNEIREVARHPLIDVVSHTHNLHRGVIYNPQGNEAPAAANRIYNPATKTYESEELYRYRLRRDMEQAWKTLKERTGTDPKGIAWPYGKYNSIAVEEARRAGFRLSFALNDKFADPSRFSELNRFMIYRNPSIQDFAKLIGHQPDSHKNERFLQADLDYLYNDDPVQRNNNLGIFLDRVKALKPSAVIVQAFADPDADGNIQEVYFPNRVLPERADFLNRVVHQIKTRSRVPVYVWMPMLSLALPDSERHQRLRVHEYNNGAFQPSSSWYERLSPFSEEARGLIRALYEDLAIHVWFDGLIFQDDGYLNDFEDFHPEAREIYTGLFGSVRDPSSLSDQERRRWTREKTATLDELSVDLMSRVLYHRPETLFGRTYYAPVLSNPVSEEWFNQSYASALELYDHVILMAYPYMEKAPRPKDWLKDLVRAASAYPGGLEKTVFKIQTVNWNTDQYISSNKLLGWMRTLVAAGARNIGYYPDDYTINHPDTTIIRDMMSTEDFPFPRTWEP